MILLVMKMVVLLVIHHKRRVDHVLNKMFLLDVVSLIIYKAVPVSQTADLDSLQILSIGFVNLAHLIVILVHNKRFVKVVLQASFLMVLFVFHLLIAQAIILSMNKDVSEIVL